MIQKIEEVRGRRNKKALSPTQSAVTKILKKVEIIQNISITVITVITTISFNMCSECVCESVALTHARKPDSGGSL